MKTTRENGRTVVEGAIPLFERTETFGGGDYDVLKVVWDKDAKNFAEVMVDTTRGGMDPVTFTDTLTDADLPEIIAVKADRIFTQELHARQGRAAAIERGARVEILGNGRKTQTDRRSGIETKPVKGDTGAVLWIGTGFGGERRLGIKIDRTGGMVFTGLKVKRIEVEPIDEAAVREYATRVATETVNNIRGRTAAPQRPMILAGGPEGFGS